MNPVCILAKQADASIKGKAEHRNGKAEDVQALADLTAAQNGVHHSETADAATADHTVENNSTLKSIREAEEVRIAAMPQTDGLDASAQAQKSGGGSTDSQADDDPVGDVLRSDSFSPARRSMQLAREGTSEEVASKATVQDSASKQQEKEEASSHFTKGAYFIGKAVWGKVLFPRSSSCKETIVMCASLQQRHLSAH